MANLLPCCNTGQIQPVQGGRQKGTCEEDREPAKRIFQVLCCVLYLSQDKVS